MPIWFALFQVLRQFAVKIENIVMNLGNLPGFGSVSFPVTVGGDPAKFLPDGSALAVAARADEPLRFLWMDMRITPTEAFQSGIATAIPYVVVIFIVMGTAYWQQRQTTVQQKPGQEQQQQPGQAVMKIFPIFFGFISFTLPAGLVVYFAASQIFRIGQQALILRMGDGKKPAGGGAPKTKQDTPKPERKAEPKKPASPTPRPTAQRRPQGSKKKRGKKRRRR
jgi:hypothetical protein